MSQLAGQWIQAELLNCTRILGSEIAELEFVAAIYLVWGGLELSYRNESIPVVITSVFPLVFPVSTVRVSDRSVLGNFHQYIPEDYSNYSITQAETCFFRPEINVIIFKLKYLCYNHYQIPFCQLNDVTCTAAQH